MTRLNSFIILKTMTKINQFNHMVPAHGNCLNYLAQLIKSTYTKTHIIIEAIKKYENEIQLN